MNIKKWQIFASIFCLILGTILHFTYEWFNYNVMVGLFSAVNESVWEHLKLLFYPMFFISIIGYFKIGRKLCNYWYTQMIGVVFALIFVVVFFYTYTGIIGKNFFLLDIASFIIFTVYPPIIPLFEDPIYGIFGIEPKRID